MHDHPDYVRSWRLRPVARCVSGAARRVVGRARTLSVDERRESSLFTHKNRG
jgi:hypothetical protein